MHATSAVGRPIIQSGARVLLLAALIALAACANSSNSASSASSAITPVASADASSSVNNVSDALGQRLDSMLNSQHTANR
jgi:hypothetical protein